MNNFKRILSFVLAICAVFCISLAVVSCNGDSTSDTTADTTASNTPEGTNNDTTTAAGNEEQTTAASSKVTYKAKVVDANGAPVVGAFVQICQIKEDGSTGVCYMPMATDENGEIAKELEKGTYKVRIDSATGYTYSDEYTQFDDTYSATLTVTAAN